MRSALGQAPLRGVPETAIDGTLRSRNLLAISAFWGLIGLMAWAPLPFASNRPWSWSLLSLAVGALLILWALSALKEPTMMRLSWRRYRTALALFALAVLWGFAQTSALIPDALHNPLWQQAARALGYPLDGAISGDPIASRGGLMRLIAYGGVFWLAAQFARDATNARRLTWCVAIIGTLYSLYGIVVFSTGNKWVLWYERWAYSADLTSTFVSRSAFGAFAGIALLSALALLLQSTYRNAARDVDSKVAFPNFLDALSPTFYALVGACLILTTALLLTHSRGALAVTAIGLAVMMACVMMRRHGRRRYFLIAAGTIVVIGFAITEMSGRVTLGRALQLADQGTGREAIHAVTRRGIDAAPLTGHGLDTFRQLYFQHRDLTIPWDSPRYDKAHSTYLELILELGWIGAGLFLAAISFVVIRVFRGVLSRRRNILYPAWGLGVTALVGTHALLDFSVQMPAVALTYATILGVAFAQSWSSGAATELAKGVGDKP